ncbi:tryptophan 2,3-dioxygenase family protein [Streptomyces sp. DSM 44915]|uniref:Tryptophan 2,3-dioxygenase family protein n=1 Tax=Streptomyces chisholmiae TaxID=3075540 RepID=A0ABU2JU01_9ACTN|nr:tryptophan 2,3-dioxygenase family protein [Streptomyces sp. DSM 44915]MDT0268467.1 tryptophan 2,3-dioxygenase family protein [Streptomyces sp. DSM 44915]
MTVNELAEEVGNPDPPPLSYGQLLRLDQLLPVARVHEEDPDWTLFLATHQSCEIWFAIVLCHLEAAGRALRAGDGTVAAHRVEALPQMMRVLNDQFDALSTLTPEAFARVRARLGNTSGFQSVQWREIEFLCGLRDERLLLTHGLTEADRERLRARLAAPSVADSLARYRAAGPPAAALDRVHAALLGFDEAVVTWRGRHAALAERFLGDAPGTAGSEGADYLWRAARRRLFPMVWPGG